MCVFVGGWTSFLLRSMWIGTDLISSVVNTSGNLFM